jgi:hypothetical protein
MSCCEIAVSPETFPMASQETLPLTFDATDQLLAGETISNPTAQLIQLDTGQDYAAGRQGAVVVAGALLTQTVTALVPRKRYRLVIRFEVALGKAWAPYLLIDCPE